MPAPPFHTLSQCGRGQRLDHWQPHDLLPVTHSASPTVAAHPPQRRPQAPTASDAPVQSDSLRYAPVRLPRVRYRRILPRTPPALVLAGGYLPACHAVGFGFEPSGTENFPSSHETILCLPDGVSPPVPVHRAPPRMFRVTYFHGPFRRSSQLVASPKTRRTYPPGFQNPPYSSAVG